MANESIQIPPSSSFLSEEIINDDKINKKQCQRVSALKRVLVTFFLYSLAFTLVIPAFPSLLLRINHGRSDRASTMYGAASCIRYFLEFFSSPFLGNLSDSYGRKKILIMSLAIMSLELLAMGIFPSIITIFVMSCLSGLGNAAMAMGYAIVTDIAHQKNESVTNNFGYFSAVFGLGFVMGPLCGSLLIDISLQLCFLVAGGICMLGCLFTFLFLDETCANAKVYDISRASPLASLRVFFSNKDLRQLAVPYCLSNLCTGIYFIWVLYMTHRFNATIRQVGIFLSISGVCGVLMQGVAIPFLIPNILSDERATIIGLALSSLQLLAYGFCPALWTFYLVLVMLSPGSLYGPALKALMAKTAVPEEQGALQGALGSLRTVTAGVGSLIFTAAFSVSITMDHPKIAGLPFYLAAAIYCYSYLHTKYYLKYYATSLSTRNKNEHHILRLPNISHMVFGYPSPVSINNEESTNLLGGLATHSHSSHGSYDETFPVAVFHNTELSPSHNDHALERSGSSSSSSARSSSLLLSSSTGVIAGGGGAGIRRLISNGNSSSSGSSSSGSSSSSSLLYGPGLGHESPPRSSSALSTSQGRKHSGGSGLNTCVGTSSGNSAINGTGETDITWSFGSR